MFWGWWRRGPKEEEPFVLGTPDPNDEPFPVIRADGPPFHFDREEAAYKKEEARLVRDHVGKVALIHNDDVVGAFDTADEAFLEGCRRFGYVRMLVKEIRDPNEPPDFVSLVDLDHPSIKHRLEQNGERNHG
jgi:hypothetical protein